MTVFSRLSFLPEWGKSTLSRHSFNPCEGPQRTCSGHLLNGTYRQFRSNSVRKYPNDGNSRLLRMCFNTSKPSSSGNSRSKTMSEGLPVALSSKVPSHARYSRASLPSRTMSICAVKPHYLRSFCVT